MASINSAQHPSRRGGIKKIYSASLEEVTSLTAAEQRMVYIKLNSPDETTYNIPFCVHFYGGIDLLANAQTVAVSIPILRTRFVNGKAIEDAKVSIADVTGADSSKIQRILYCHFDMEEGPLCRFGVDTKTNILYGCIHHSIADCTSLQILFEAIASGEVKNETVNWSIRKYAALEGLPEVISEQQELAKRCLEMLGDTPPRLEVDFAVPNSYYKSSITLDSDTRAALDAYCRRENISLFVLSLGIMHHAIRAYSHESFAIGTAYNTRCTQFCDTVGMFVNTVLIPFAKGVEGGKETLKELNNRWRNEIRPLATTPYDKVAAEGYGCNVYLAYNVGIMNTSGSAPKMQPLPKLEEGHRFKAPEAMFDLTVEWLDSSTGDGSVEVSFESGIGAWPGIEDRFNQIIGQILNTSSSSPPSPLVVDNLLPQERAQVIEWGTGAKDTIRNCCLHELVEEQAQIRPDAIALMNNCGRDKMTYGELNAKAHRLAVELQKRGVKPNSFVGILMGGEKTFEMCVAVLGVLKSGAAYVPMDAVLFPAERIKFIAEDTNMKWIVTVGEYANVVEGEFETMLVEEVMEMKSNDEVVLERDVKPEDCAYMIYTSGTTGTPKGVVCHHLGPVNMIFYDSGTNVRFGGLPGEDVVGCSAPHIFDMFVHGYFGSLGSGLTFSLDMKCITMFIGTPFVAEIILSDKTNDVKLLLTGGDAAIQGLESRVSTFINGYGPTEASMTCAAGNSPDTIGNPLPNTLLYVVHPDDGTLCPPGVSGELWVGGIGVGIGYHNRPELTAEKFISDPFSESGRVYKTGDRVKWNEDGELVFLGRFDHQVKVRGYRIELGEIQAELEKQEGVKGALVVVHDEDLVAFVASGMDDSLKNDALVEDLMAGLKKSDSCRLPSYMVPSLILVLEEFPLNQNGKIDRKLLMSQLADVAVGSKTEYVAPVTEEEVAMIDEWHAILGNDRNIGMNDNFFDIGGHSILAMKLAATLGFDVRLITLHPTPASLLARLQSLEGGSSVIEYASLKEVDCLTKAEQLMVYIQLNNPDETTYNLPFCVQFDSGIDLLANAVRVVDSIPILRTRFVNGKAIEDAVLSVDDLTGIGADSSEIQRILYCLFDMTAGPLCRFGVDRNTNMLYACIHHSIADGRSMQILLEAIAAGDVKNETRDWSVRRYAAYEALPEVIAEQQASVERYVEMLGDTPARLEVDFAVPDSYYRSSITLDSDRRAALEAYCRQEKISLFSFALGVIHEAMRAYSHESFAIGTVYDARPSQFHNTVGVFVNTVLIPFGKGVEARKETLKELNDRWSRDILPLARTPYDMITAAGYGCNVYLTYNVGIFDTSEDSPKMQPLPKLEGGNSDVAPTAKFDLYVTWSDSSSGDGSIQVSFESGIGPWPGIEDRFNQIIGQILNTLSSSSSSPPCAIDILLPQERAQVLEWGTGTKDTIRNCCLHELVEEQAQIRPDAIALMNKCGSEKMTYGELNAKAHRLAVELQKRGVKPNSFVGILMGGEKTFEMCVAVLGVLKSGAAYVPMDAVLFPAERIKFIAEDTNMKLIVTVGEYANVVEGEFETMLVEEVMEEKSNDEVVLERDVKPEDCAYMIYTSGTTGTPKGVVCNHFGPVNLVFYDTGVKVFSKCDPEDDVVGCSAPIIFDVFILGYFGSLGSGRTLSLDMKCLTTLICTPSAADLFLSDKTNNIRVMSVAGEACIQGIELKVANFTNRYGMTEAYDCTISNKPNTIGNPLPNTILYVVNPDDGTLCPPGVSGELWIGGIGVSKGYHNRPELTAEKFILNPFSTNSGRVYKTGDRVKWNEDGELVYLGRFDDQVKIRGYRIELGEIQAELEKQEGVNGGALVVVHDENLVAFVASGMDDSLQNDALVEDLVAALKKSDSCRLPSYMVPSHILVLEEFPLTRNGKIDRKLLMSQLADVAVGSKTEYVAPVTEEEVAMIEEWHAVLGPDRIIGMNDDFFDIGGHSILAMALAASLECDVPLISSHPTPASLLAHLQSMEGDSSRVDYASLEEVASLTGTEQRMVYIQLNSPDETTYNIPFCVQFDGDIDLLANVQTVVDSIPVLRTRFVNGKAIEDAKVSIADVTGADSGEIQSILYCHFDMTAGPLCRFGVDTKANILYGNIHHSIADGRSFQILFEAIAAGKVKNETVNWSIRKYAALETLPEVISEQQACVERFVEMLGDTPPRLEVDFAVPNSYHTSSFTLDSNTRAALDAYCRQENISLFSLALGVMHHAIRAYSRESFAIGTAYDARPPQFHHTIGMFVNTVLIPFAKGVEGGKETLKELNDRWRNDILPLTSAPFDKVSAQGYGCDVYLAFNVGIIETSGSAPKMQPLPKLEEGHRFKAPSAMFDLTVEWMESSSGDGSVEISFESGIGAWPGIEDRFNQIISQILNTSSSPSYSPLIIDNLLPQERAQVIEWGTGAKDTIRNCCLHELVEEQAQIRPDAIALMNKCGKETMTYGELNAKAHRLAVELQKRGAKPNSFVGILMGGEKTFEMCVAVLGVLKSGAAYVPMDAVLFPAERIKFIAEDTNMKLIVTVGEYANVVEGEFETMLVEEVVEEKSNDEVVLERDVKPEDCAYMIYTSGTTGTPKGVVCHHLGPVNMIFYDSGIKVFDTCQPGEDVVGCSAPIIFDVFVYGYFGALGGGVTLSLDMKCITLLHCTPSVADIFLSDKTNSIESMAVGGEACIQGLESKAESFINIYGPTEASIWCTASTRADIIGNPLPNTLLYVVDPDDGTLCPPGVSGELWVGGIGVGIGYHNRPELTAEKFISDPFSESGRVYKTGDRVKWNEDGELVFFGRFDHQVKVRGYRIELGEIQAELEKQEGVKGALVVVHDEDLVAFVASGMDDSLKNDALVEDLMAALKKSDSCRLPSYMVPSHILVLEEFPLNQNGKIDRKLLMSQLADVAVGTRTKYVAPVKKEEVAMIDEWHAVLGSDRIIGMNDNFFDIGGHSILAMKLAAALECDVRLISSYPTPASLLAHLQSMEGDSSRVDYASLEEVASLTAAEQRMVYIQLSNPDETTYNIPFCVQFDSGINLLANAQTVVDSIPVLRTRFVNGKAIEDAKVSIADVTGADSSKIQHILYCHFDMEEGPLCRFGVDTKANILYACIHHSIADGRSFQILFEAIATDEVKNETVNWSIRKYAALEGLPEVISEQQELVKRCVEMLGDTPARLEVDFAVSSSYHSSCITLDSNTRAALDAYCRQENISLFSLALGVMHHAIRAYSRESFAIGTAYDARPPQFHDTVGMFVNTVLIPFAKGVEGGKETLKELNDRWRNDILPLTSAPFDKVSAQGYGCDVYLAFNVGIIETSGSAPKMQPLPKLEEGHRFKAPSAMFDLTVAWMECSSGDGSVEVSFESGIGAWPGIEDRFNQIISQILNASSSSPPSPLVVDNLLPQERAQVIEWGTGAKDTIRNCCLHELVEEQAQIRPDAIALMNNCGRDKMTYGELNAKAHRLAVELQKRGVKPNSFVGILMGGEKTFEMCVAVLGVLKSGAAYVPMDAVLFPAERIKFIAEDTNMKWIVTVGEYANVVEGEFETMLVEEVMEMKSNDEVVLERDVKPEDCAYMIYTSGTTGTPKGVVCHHLGPVNMIFYDSGTNVRFGGLPGEDVVGCSAPHIFDMFVHGYFGSLGSGLTFSLDMKCITMFIGTPFVAEIILSDKTNDVKLLLTGGDAAIQGLESRVSTFINGYGPTEASMTCAAGNSPDTIGNPLPNTLLYVVHPDDGTLCPPGVSGELWVGGIGVGIGYHNRPELTAEKFISDPFSESGRVYKTGDRVKWNEDGELVFLGRFDHQVKVRGYRIELGEIQAELEKQEGVKGALVVVHDEDLVAFVASGMDDSLKNDALVEDLMAGLKKSDSCRLPSYMVPSLILVLEEFPLNQNGKIDRKLLMSQLADVAVGSKTEYVAPVTEEEVAMIDEWHAILGNDRNIGMNDNFFDIGGHSILAMKLAATLGFDVRLITLHPTPASLLARLQSLEGGSSVIEYASLKEVDCLTKAEQLMVYIQLNNPDETTYNLPFCVQFDSGIDLLANAVRVVDSIPILRTRFVNGKAIEDAVLSVDDLTGIGADSSEIQRILYCLFDMTAGPLCRFGVDRNTNMLYACIHHSIADGRSMQILLEAIAAGDVKNETRDWSVRRYAAYEALPEVIAEQQASVERYVEMLGDTPARLEVDFAVPDSYYRSSITLDSDRRAALEAYCRQEKISLFSFALGVIHEAMRAYSHESFAIGTVYDARPSQFHNTVGVFVNTVLIPFGKGVEARKETLKELNDRWSRDILPLARTPYDMITAAGYGCNVYLTYNVGIFDTSEDSPKMQPLPKLEGGNSDVAPTAKFDLYVTWSDSSSGDGSIQVSFESGIGPWPGIEDRFNQIIGQILNTLSSSSSSPPCAIDILLPQERAQVLEWGTGTKDTIRNCCLHELVEEQAQIRPDAIALMNKCGSEKMTYGELNAKAHRLAVELQKRGVKPNSFVGILTGGEKTFEMCVAVLGVLKSGAAYVPMDAVLFPAERIKFIAEDTNMKLIVTVGEYANVVEGEFETMLVEEVMEEKSNDEVVLERDVKPEDCAYMIYTSGTTGTPKGVVCNHFGPVNLVFYDTGVKVFSKCDPEDDVVGCSAPIIFDVFILGYFGSLGSGRTLSLDMKCLTTLICTPSAADLFLSDKTNNIRVMSVAGEACIQGIELKVANFTNRYGMTEAYDCTISNKPNTIGNPLPNTILYVVNPDDGTLCPPGVSGELWIGGIGVSKGYHNRPELTAEKFILNPFSTNSGRVYKTGDRVKWNEDGELVYLGRFDDQVKIRGYRIELGEIQAELEKQEGVNGGALVVVHDENLVAFVASGMDDSLQNDALVEDLVAALKKSDSCSLPSYMVPSHILVLEEFPLNQNGKIDRKLLMSQLADVAVGSKTEYVAPVTEEEVAMIDEWHAVLGSDRIIGMNDNFFDIGGHSILAMALAASLECDVRLISSYPTPASLLAHLQSMEGDSSRVDYASLEEVTSLTAAEQRMVYIKLNSPDETTYNMPFCVQFDDDIDLLANVQTVVDSIPVLRTRFVNGEAIEDAKVSIADVTGADSSKIQSILYCHFDMEEGPLCRFGVDTKANILYGNIHHSIADGRSFQILFEAIAAGEVKNETRYWSIRKYAALETLPEVISEQQACVERFVEMLGDTPPRLEVDFAVPNSYHTSSITLDSGTRVALDAYCRRENISLFSLALGVMHHAIRAYSRESFAIGTAYDARPPQFHHTIGMFVNTVLIPFAKGVEGGKETLKELNDRWRNDILPLTSAPFDKVSAQGYGCDVYLAFNVGIIETSGSAPKMQPLPKLEGGNSDVAPTAKFDLTVAWMESSSGDASVEVSFKSGIGAWPGIEDRFNQIISQILNASSLPPPSPLVMDTLLPQERAQVIEWGTGAKDTIRNCCLHELVEEQAQIRPDAIALMNNCGKETMTYGELNAKAHRLAVELQKRGAKPNSFVGILMGGEKTFEMYVAVLGVLKSGAAYVPMDAVLFSAERIKFIAEDTNMELMVTVGEYANVVEGEFETMLVEEVMEMKSNDEVVLDRDVKPEDCAYMIYTSGTTGTPKGVLCHHLGPVNTIVHVSAISGFTEGRQGIDVVGSAAPLIFDPFVYGYFGALGGGLTLSLDMKCLTMLTSTPSMADIYLSDKTNDIEVMLVGGEACIQGLESRVSTFINAYGPTEASIQCTAGNGPDTIGNPLPNTLLYVVHPDDGTLCPPGVSGELWVGGIGVSIGYHNRPELTAEKFIPDPFANSGRVYKTGDRVKWNEDGELVFLGRFDHQVKVRGYRIELGEIQAELEKQEGVNGALVVVHDENLVAFVTSGMDDTSQHDALVEHIMAALKSDSCRLPSYMVPWKILVLDKFPLTQNNKIDRKLLTCQLQEDLSRAYLVASLNAAETITQQFLCALFEEILNVDAVGIDCDFIDRGGHSLLVMQAVSRIREEFDIDSFTVRQFIELKTARNIAQKIDEILKDKRQGKGTFRLQSINSIVGSTVSRDDQLLLKLLIKAVAVLALFISSWVAILPANVLLSKALSIRVRYQDRIGVNAAREELRLFSAAIGVMIAAYLMFFVCLALLSCFYGYLLRKAIGKGSATIKRSSVTYGLWYVFDRLWFMTRMIGSSLLHGTIFHTWFYKVYGGDIGGNNFFEGTDVRLPFMLTTGDNVVVEAGSKLETVVIKKNGDVAVDELVLGDDTVIGPNTHVGLGAKIGASCMIKCLSLVQRGRKIPDATMIEGHETADLNQTEDCEKKQLVEDQVVASLGWHLVFLLISFIPAMMLIMISVLVIFAIALLPYTLALFLSLHPILMTVEPIFVAICMLPLRFALVGGRAKAGWEKVNSKSFLRRQLATSLYHSSLNILDGTVVYHLVSRFIFGAKIDVRSSFIPPLDEPDLTSVGNCVFGANGVLLRNTMFYPGGIARYGKVDISDQVMILDRAVVSPDTSIKEKVMVAPITAVYDDTIDEEGTVLLGTPALSLTRKTADVEMEITSEPLIYLLLQYFIFIYFKYIVRILTLSAFYANGVVFWKFYYCDCDFGNSAAIGISVAVLPLSLLALVVVCLTLSLAVKWIVIGNFKRFQSKGLMAVDSWDVFRWMIANQLIHTAAPFVLQLIDEFWLTATFWKMMGAKIGTNTRVDPDVLLLEVDLLEIGDNCRVEEEATLLCHRFNDGGLKLERMVIPSNSYIQNRAVILPGSEVSEEHVTILPLTPLNPGEKLTAGHWQGSPAERIYMNNDGDNSDVDVEVGLGAPHDERTYMNNDGDNSDVDVEVGLGAPHDDGATEATPRTSGLWNSLFGANNNTATTDVAANAINNEDNTLEEPLLNDIEAYVI